MKINEATLLSAVFEEFITDPSTTGRLPEGEFIFFVTSINIFTVLKVRTGSSNSSDRSVSSFKVLQADHLRAKTRRTQPLVKNHPT